MILEEMYMKLYRKIQEKTPCTYTHIYIYIFVYFAKIFCLIISLCVCFHAWDRLVGREEGCLWSTWTSFQALGCLADVADETFPNIPGSIPAKLC